MHVWHLIKPRADSHAKKWMREMTSKHLPGLVLRRSCDAWLIQEGVDTYRVSKYLMHSSVTVTEKHYVDILPSELIDLASIASRQIVISD